MKFYALSILFAFVAGSLASAGKCNKLSNVCFENGNNENMASCQGSCPQNAHPCTITVVGQPGAPETGKATCD
ncbi:hypothetical protein F5B20DRAFT_324543 [Whalleya microplaca]|nr:hypothetical protein F5B20DRAFT_324543 [Whalleya microplaca]